MTGGHIAAGAILRYPNEEKRQNTQADPPPRGPERHGPPRGCGGAEYHRDAGNELHALRDVRHRFARHSGDRRFQALAPKAPLHDVQDGASHRRAHEEREHRRTDDALKPPWRRRDLRHDGAPFQGLRRAAAPVRRLEGQLRQGLFARHGVGGQPIHRGEARAHLRRTLPRHRL